MDKNGFKFNFFWTNGVNRASTKSLSNQQPCTVKSTFFNGSNDIIQSRFFTILVIALVCNICLNIVLSFWIIKSLQVGNGGLGDGNLSVTSKRMTVKGSAKFNGWLTAEQVNPVHRDQGISIVGTNENIQLASQNHYAEETLEQINPVTFLMNNSNISYQGPNLIVTKIINGSKEILFSIDSDQLITNSLGELKSTDWGFVVDDKIETSSIKGDFYHDLRLESRIKGLNMQAVSSDLNMKARAGRIDFNSFKEIILSADNQIKINSSNIRFESLPKQKLHRHHDDHSTRKEMVAYQVCVCENGRLFLTPGNKACFASSETCLSVSNQSLNI